MSLNFSRASIRLCVWSTKYALPPMLPIPVSKVSRVRKRRLFKEHHDLLARKRLAKIGRARLHDSGKMQYGFDPVRTEIASRHQIGAPECLRYP